MIILNKNMFLKHILLYNSVVTACSVGICFNVLFKSLLFELMNVYNCKNRYYIFIFVCFPLTVIHIL